MHRKNKSVLFSRRYNAVVRFNEYVQEYECRVYYGNIGDTVYVTKDVRNTLRLMTAMLQDKIKIAYANLRK